MQDRHDRPPTNKKAVLAFVFGLIGVVFSPALIPAIVLWYLAVRDFHRTPDQKGLRLARTGVIAGLVVNIAVISTILLLVGIQEIFPTGPDILTAIGDSLNRFYDQSTLTSWFREGRQRNEAAVLAIFPLMRDSLNRFYVQHQGYPSAIQQLVDNGLLQPEQAQPALHGYLFEYIVSDRNLKEVRGGQRLYSRFLLVARPESLFTGKRVFYLDEKGAIHVYESRDPEAKEERAIPPPADWGKAQSPGGN